MKLKFKNTEYGSRMVVLVVEHNPISRVPDSEDTEIEFDEFVVCNLLLKEHNKGCEDIRKNFEDAIRIAHTIANEHGEAKAWAYLRRECERLKYPVTGGNMLLELVRSRRNGLPETVESRIKTILDGSIS